MDGSGNAASCVNVMVRTSFTSQAHAIAALSLRDSAIGTLSGQRVTIAAPPTTTDRP